MNSALRLSRPDASLASPFKIFVDLGVNFIFAGPFGKGDAEFACWFRLQCTLVFPSLPFVFCGFRFVIDGDELATGVLEAVDLFFSKKRNHKSLGLPIFDCRLPIVTERR